MCRDLWQRWTATAAIASKVPDCTQVSGIAGAAGSSRWLVMTGPACQPGRDDARTSHPCRAHTTSTGRRGAPGTARRAPRGSSDASLCTDRRTGQAGPANGRLAGSVGRHAGVAQLVAQATCNRQVVGSSPTTGSRSPYSAVVFASWSHSTELGHTNNSSRSAQVGRDMWRAAPPTRSTRGQRARCRAPASTGGLARRPTGAGGAVGGPARPFIHREPAGSPGRSTRGEPILPGAEDRRSRAERGARRARPAPLVRPGSQVERRLRYRTRSPTPSCGDGPPSSATRGGCRARGPGPAATIDNRSFSFSFGRRSPAAAQHLNEPAGRRRTQLRHSEAQRSWIGAEDSKAAGGVHQVCPRPLAGQPHTRQ